MKLLVSSFQLLCRLQPRAGYMMIYFCSLFDLFSIMAPRGGVWLVERSFTQLKRMKDRCSLFSLTRSSSSVPVVCRDGLDACAMVFLGAKMPALVASRYV